MYTSISCSDGVRGLEGYDRGEIMAWMFGDDDRKRVDGINGSEAVTTGILASTCDVRDGFAFCM